MKKTIAVFLAFLLAFSGVIGVCAASFSDTGNHWAENNIEYMVKKSIISGYPDGTFLPEQSVTRVEFIKMICETFGLTATTRISFSDVSSEQWFYPYVAKAAAQGFLLNYGSSMGPTAILSRQEAAALLARYLDLDPDKKADPSVYNDYTSIKSAYRDYVLQATYDGLFKGRDGNRFDPDAPLKRSEALTILYRAAGSIYRDTTTGQDLGAADGNAVISVSGISISDAELDGRVIVTEGASGDSVVFENCDINELILRGTTSITLSGCMVKHMVIDSSTSGYTASVSLIDNTEIDKFTMNTPAEVSLESRTEIDLMTVESTARNSSVTGKGTLSQVKIRAKGFEADQVPLKYELSAGISASFGGKSYSGISTSDAFSVQPTTHVNSTSCYLTATSSVAGTLQYYFTTSSTAPTSAQFASYYATASQKGSFAVSAKVSFDSSIAVCANVSTYSYLVVMVTDASGNAYQPVLVTNLSSNGFSGTPSVSTGMDSYDYLNSTPIFAGQVYYYYTSSATALTVSSFTKGFGSANPSVRGSIAVTANQMNSSKLLSTTGVPVSSYPYLAIMLLPENGECQPVLISRTGSSTSGSASIVGTGFYSVPTCTLYNNAYRVSVVPSYAGTLEYYYSKTATVPTSAEFTQQMASLKTSTLSSMFSGEKTVSAYQTIAIDTNALVLANYEYIVLRLRTSTTTFVPFVLKLSISNGATTDITGTGLVNTPTISTGLDGKLSITLQTRAATTVYWYLTNNATVSTSSIFMNNWASSQLSATKTGGYTTTTGLQQTISTGLAATSSVVAANKYIAIMVSSGTSISGDSYYTPLVLPLPSTSTGGYNAIGNTGITGTPSFNTYNDSVKYVTITPTVTGKAYYYYSNSSTLPMAAEIRYLFDANRITTPCGTASVTMGSTTNLTLYGAASSYSYVVVMIEGTDGTQYQPFLVNASGETTSNGFQTAPTITAINGNYVLTYSTSGVGTIRYYYTSSTLGIPTGISAFETAYNAAGVAAKGTWTVNSAGYGAQAVNPALGTYLVVMYVDYSGNKHAPVALASNGSGSIGGTTGTANTGFSVNPQLAATGFVTYKSSVDGTLFFFTTNATTLYSSPSDFLFSSSNENIISKSTQAVTKDTQGYIGLGSEYGKYLWVMLQGSDGKTYTPVCVQVK